MSSLASLTSASQPGITYSYIQPHSHNANHASFQSSRKTQAQKLAFQVMSSIREEQLFFFPQARASVSIQGVSCFTAQTSRIRFHPTFLNTSTVLNSLWLFVLFL